MNQLTVLFPLLVLGSAVACGGASQSDGAASSAGGAAFATGGAGQNTGGRAMTAGGAGGTPDVSPGGTVGSGGRTSSGGNSPTGGAVSSGGWSTGGGPSIGGSGIGGKATTGGSSGIGASAGATTMPSECQVQAAAPAVAQPISFKLTNTDSEAKFLADLNCGSALRVYSCADGYTQPVRIAAGCTQPCASNLFACILCGACPPATTTVAAGSATTVGWGGNVYTYSNVTLGSMNCSCHTPSIAPAGKYRASIDIYATNEAALSRGAIWNTASVDFEYPDNDGVVTLNF